MSHIKKLKSDTRILVNNQSPIWTKAIGKIIVPTSLKFVSKKKYKEKFKKCSATLVSLKNEISSNFIVTASHCFTSYDKNAGDIRFIIKSYGKKMVYRTVKIVIDSNFNIKKLNSQSDYTILKLNKPISKKTVHSMNVTSTSFYTYQKLYKYTYGALSGFSSDIGNNGYLLTIDSNCKLSNYTKYYAKSNCTGFKGASGGPIILSISTDNKNFEYRFVGVVSHFKKGKFQEIYFSPHQLFADKLLTLMKNNSIKKGR